MPTFESLTERRSFWKRHVTACNESPLSKASYCREHKLTYSQLIYWFSRFDVNKQPAVACAESEPPATQSSRASRLLPVVLREHQDSQAGIQITLPSGVVITGITEQHVSVALQLLDQQL